MSITVKGEIVNVDNVFTFRSKNFQLIEIQDSTGKIQAVWFNQPYLTRTLKKGVEVSLSGKVDLFNRKLSFISPEYEVYNNTLLHTGRLVPVYPGTAGVSTKWLRSRIHFVYGRLKDELIEFLPDSFLSDKNLWEWGKAVKYIHYPETAKDTVKARERLAFNELLFLQLNSLARKLDWQENKLANKLNVDNGLIGKFTKSLPYKLTNSQTRTIEELVKDLTADKPMNRLLEGDVGSGKTVVAAAAAFIAYANGFQTVFMAPTQILAQQHFETLKNIFSIFKARVSLITSQGVQGDIGKTDIWVGTHSLIHRHALPLAHKTTPFENVALVIIDEQHRFGVEQRSHLIKKSGSRKIAPHVLTMTATPIPRTVALTVHGDLDLSTLDELPHGRKPITTWIVPPKKRDGAYGWIKQQIEKDKVQVFVVCPLIDESESESMQQVKAATTEFANLQPIFPEYKLGLLHGKLKAKEKNDILQSFKEGEIDILVTTPVVEVGIDIPNATIMVIEASERFGLAQLHQLRGRVGRGKLKSYCLLFTQNRSQKSQARLKALTTTMSGFKLAELDLKLRGPGEVIGTRQHGFSNLKIANWQDTKLIKLSRELAKNAVEDQRSYKKLFEKMGKSRVVLN